LINIDDYMLILLLLPAGPVHVEAHALHHLHNMTWFVNRAGI